MNKAQLLTNQNWIGTKSFILCHLKQPLALFQLYLLKILKATKYSGTQPLSLIKTSSISKWNITFAANKDILQIS